MVTAQVTGVPNPVQVAKSLTDQTWQMPTNYWLVFFVFAFGIGVVLLVLWIVRRAEKQSEALDKLQSESAATNASYEVLSEDVRELLRSLAMRLEAIESQFASRLDRIWEELMRLAGRIK